MNILLLPFSFGLFFPLRAASCEPLLPLLPLPLLLVRELEMPETRRLGLAQGGLAGGPRSQTPGPRVGPAGAPAAGGPPPAPRPARRGPREAAFLNPKKSVKEESTGTQKYLVNKKMLNGCDAPSLLVHLYTYKSVSPHGMLMYRRELCGVSPFSARECSAGPRKPPRRGSALGSSP